MSIGENIRHIRIEKNLTQKELGEKLGGLSQQQIGQWENNNKTPKLETIRKIAAVLGVYISDLVDNWNEFSNKEIEEDWTNDNYYLNKSEKPLLDSYRQLNNLGQEEAQKRVEELTEIPRYTKPED